MKHHFIHRKALSLVLSLSLVLGPFGPGLSGAHAASADSPVTLYLDSGDITIDEYGYTAGGGGHIGYSGDYRITQHDSGAAPTVHCVAVGMGGGHNITIENINIDVSAANDMCAFAIQPTAGVTLTLAGKNTLKSGNNRAGLEVPNGTVLTVTEQSTGSLTATGGDTSAGIGSANGQGGMSGHIIIDGGTITANGGSLSAGIGGGEGGEAGTIEINGGSVTANGGGHGAGIGGGEAGHGANLTINGGTVIATSGVDAAGIGGGNGGGGGDTIINGGTVTATGSPGSHSGGAGIGGGGHATDPSLFVNTGGYTTINGGIVIANGGPYSAGIGGGEGASGNIITIRGGSVTANGGTVAGILGGAGIGGGSSADGGTVTVSGGAVTACGGNGGAGIGGGAGGAAGAVTITSDDAGPEGCSVMANGGSTGSLGGAGIGGGNDAAGGTVSISGTNTQVTAKGINGSRDIGSGSGNNDGGNLTVGDSGAAEPLPVLMLFSAGSNAAPHSYTNCRIITCGADFQTETVYDGSGSPLSDRPEVVNASLSVKRTADGRFTLTASAKNRGGSAINTGTFSFSYLGAKDSGPVPGADAVSVGTDGTASVPWAPPGDSPVLFTAQYTDPTGAHDALKSLFFYDPCPIDIGTVSESGFGYTYDVLNRMVTVTQNGWYGFTGTTTQNAVTVAGGTSACVTLQNVNIDVSGIGGGTVGGSAFSLARGAQVHLTTEEHNILSAGGSHAGLEVPLGASLTIEDSPSGSNDLFVYGGSRTANGGAGIGGAGGGDDGDITINSGHVIANGGIGINAGGAGIGTGGSGSHYAGGVTISNGTVWAYGGMSSNLGGAGIGGGGGTSGGDVFIYGSGTTVRAIGADGGKDIGSGSGGSNGGSLTVGTDDSVQIPPKLTLTSAGTDAQYPTASRPQFMNCVLEGTGSKDVGGNDLGGTYDANGKIRLTLYMPSVSDLKIGEPVMLEAFIAKLGMSSLVAFPGKIQFTANGAPIGAPVSIAADGTAQTIWTPMSRSTFLLGAAYVPASNADRYAPTASHPNSYTLYKDTPTVFANPTASSITAGSPLSSSSFSGGNAAFNGTAIRGSFQWANPTAVVMVSGSYPAFFVPEDTADYNTVPVMIPVTVTAPPAPTQDTSHEASAPSLPSSVTEPSIGAQVDLSGATFPARVAGVSLSVSPEAAGGVPSAPGSAGAPSDPEGGMVYRLVITQTGLNLIGSPYVYNIQLLDQNGNPIPSFSGTVTVKIPIPTGIHGTPRVFRYEKSTGTFTDLGATVQNGFLVFSTDHFSYYVIAGSGDSITLDTKSYSMPLGGNYQIGMKLTGGKAASVKVTSTNGKAAPAVRLKNGNISVTGKGPGTAYIMFDVYDSKNKLLTHASVRVDVKTGIRPRGDSARQIGVF